MLGKAFTADTVFDLATAGHFEFAADFSELVTNLGYDLSSYYTPDLLQLQLKTSSKSRSCDRAAFCYSHMAETCSACSAVRLSSADKTQLRMLPVGLIIIVSACAGYGASGPYQRLS